jgi:hypothetical protein
LGDYANTRASAVAAAAAQAPAARLGAPLTAAAVSELAK